MTKHGNSIKPNLSLHNTKVALSLVPYHIASIVGLFKGKNFHKYNCPCPEGKISQIINSTYSTNSPIILMHANATV